MGATVRNLWNEFVNGKYSGFLQKREVWLVISVLCASVKY